MEDKRALHITRKFPRLFADEIWKYEIALRYREYYSNCNKGIGGKILKSFWTFVHHKKSVKLGIQIPPNTCDAGLHINHHGLLIISASAKIGKYLNVHQGVNIGENINPGKAPTIGDNVFIGPGVKIYGDITIANDIAIAAGSVVTKSFLKPGVTIGGVPARILNEYKGNPFPKKLGL
ncbi:serine acetyltransferase [Clostridium perfringens]|nr:serine acetyltransferase [Clostridium perfringens]MDK0983789.1 serine acetyltransferase [Clostridium perfringens]